MADPIKTTGPLAVLNTGGKTITQLKYPKELGEPGSHPFQHWIHFAINVQEASQATGGQSTIRTGTRGVSSIVDSISSAVQDPILFGLVGPTLLRKTNRIVAGIDLFVPSTMQFVQTNNYADTSLTQQLGYTGQFIQTANFPEDDPNNPRNSFPGATEFLNKFFGVADPQLAVQALSGKAINEQYEVLFQHTAMREFQFDFLMTPRSKDEEEQIRDIVGMFRYHAAPEVLGSYDARYLVPPSTFDISFYFRGAEQVYIPKIASCVCTQVMLDYVPNAVWNTHPTGMPTAIRMTLQFKEVELMHKLKIEQGY